MLVYFQQIGDGSEEGKKIKVITSVDKLEQAGSKGRQGISKSMFSILLFFAYYVVLVCI